MKIEVPVRLRALIALCGVVFLLGAAVVVINYGNGHYEAGYPLVARFAASSQGLYEGSDVKVRGVNVGTVERIELDDEGRALITMQIDPGVEIARTTQASIEPLSIFGPKFVNLRQGDDELTGPYFAEGETITDTRNAPEFTLVLGDASDLLEYVEPSDVTTVIHTLAQSFAGLGDTFGDTFDRIATIVDIAEANTPEFQQFLGDLALLSTTLAEHAPNIVAGAESLHEALPALNDRSDELGLLLDDIAEVSGTLSTILDENADAIGTNLVNLEPVADLLERRQGDVIQLVQTLDIFFSTLTEVIRIPNEPLTPLAGALVGQAPSDVCQLLPALPCLLGASTAATAAPATATPATAATPAAPASAVSRLEPGPLAALTDLVLTILPTSDTGLLGSLLGGGR